MVTPLDARLGPRVAEIVERFGVDVTFNVVDRVYNQSTGTVDETVEAVTVKATPRSNYNRKYIDGQSIHEGDMQTLVHGENTKADTSLLVPKTGDRILWFGESIEWSVMSVQPIETGELAAAFKLQLRQQ